MNPFDLIDDIADKIWPSQDEKLKNADLIAQLKALPSVQQNQVALAQLAINNSEAQSSSVFVSGWRPAMMWGCIVFTLLNIIISWCDQIFSWHIPNFGGGLPENIIMGALTGTYMLARTVEKIKGVAR
jgi:hypothetical protein